MARRRKSKKDVVALDEQKWLNLPDSIPTSIFFKDIFDLASGKVTGKTIARLGLLIGAGYEGYKRWKRENETPLEMNARLKREIAELEAIKENKQLLKRKKELLKELGLDD